MKNLKKLRLAANLTQAQLAKLSGYSSRNIIRFEKGQRMRQATIEMFERILIDAK